MSRRKRELGRLSADERGVTDLSLSENGTSMPSPAFAELRHSVTLTLQRHWIVSALIGLALFTTTALALKYLDDDARRQNATGTDASKGSTWLNSLNPFVSATAPAPTPQLSKEYIYAGSRLLAVEDSNANAAPPADLAVWRPSSGVWWVMGGPSSASVAQNWGTNGDIPAQGDFDGDGKTDFSIFRPSSATWWILKSSDNTYYSVHFGLTCTPPNGCDTLVHADYDGDGRTDVAVWRPSTGVWYITLSSTGGPQYGTFGTNGDKPAPADYDGDGRADIAVWRSSNKTFYSVNSSNNGFASFTFEQSSTEPVSADYDGDGKADYAIRNGNNWIIRNSSNPTAPPVIIAWQSSGDIAVQTDYDGDGKVDIAVWRDSNGTWYIRQSASNNSLRQVQWGMTGDIPVPALYRR